MAHTSWCSDSVQNPSKCECECNGYLHGIPYFNYSDYKEYEIFNEIHEIHKTDNSNFKDEIKNKIKYTSAKIKIDKDKLDTFKNNLESCDDNPKYKDLQGRYSREIICKTYLCIYSEIKSLSIDKFLKSEKILKEELQKGVIDNISDKLSDEIVNEILRKIFDKDDKEKKAVKWYIYKILYSHLICTLCAYVLEFLDKAEKEIHECISCIASEAALKIKDYITNEVKEKYNVELSKNLERNIENALKESIKKLLEKIIKINLLPEEQIDILCIVGLISCPDIADHPEIINYCANPLLKKYLKPVLQDKIRGEMDKCLNDPQRIEDLEKYIGHF